MDYSDIYSNLVEGKYEVKGAYPAKYEAGHVFDSKKTVDWNKEELIRRNIEVAALRQELMEQRNELQALFKADVILAVVDDVGISSEQANVVFSFAYERGHSAGMHTVVDEAEHYADFVRQFLTKGGKAI